MGMTYKKALCWCLQKRETVEGNLKKLLQQTKLMTHPEADEGAARTKRNLMGKVWLAIKHLREEEIIVYEQGHIQPGRETCIVRVQMH